MKCAIETGMFWVYFLLFCLFQETAFNLMGTFRKIYTKGANESSDSRVKRIMASVLYFILFTIQTNCAPCSP